MMPQQNNVLFYIPVSEDTPLFKKLHQVIATLGLEGKSEIFRTIDKLIPRLRYPEGRPRIGVILTADHKDLCEILSIQELLHDLHILLILPDTEYDTVSQGHILRPRFLTDTDANFANLAEVLRKMGNNHQVGLETGSKQIFEREEVRE